MEIKVSANLLSFSTVCDMWSRWLVSHCFPPFAWAHRLYILHPSYSWFFSFYKEHYRTEAFCSMRSRHSSALVKRMCNPLEKIRVLCSLHARAVSGNFAYSIRGYLIWDLLLYADPLIRKMIGKRRTVYSSTDLYDPFTKINHYIKKDYLSLLSLSAVSLPSSISHL